jgi:hypothetical protein
LAVEFRLGEKSRCFTQNLIGSRQLPHLAFELLETIAFRVRKTIALALVALGLPDPFTQGFGGASNLARDRDDSRPLRLVFPLVLKYQPDGPFAKLG